MLVVLATWEAKAGGLLDPRNSRLQTIEIVIFKIITQKLLEHKLKECTEQYKTSENVLRALQNVGQIGSEVLKNLTE
uniref:Uncharacterized protein n=1 Tax=Prolemur simus TaxID=1328070 RepID=A0A8C9DUQ4_PROSS